MIGSKLAKLGSREKLMLSFAGLFILAAAADYLVVQPVLESFSGLESRIKEQEKAYRYNQDYVAWEDEILERYSAVSGKLGVVSSSAEAKHEMKGQVEDLAQKTGVLLQSSDLRDPNLDSHSPCQEYFVDIKRFRADMNSLLGFLHELHTAPGMLRVVTLNVTPLRGENDVFEGSMLITKVMIPASGGA
jgi:hypothetical protein